MTFQPRQWVFLAFLIATVAIGGASAAGLGGNIALQLGAALLISVTLWSNQSDGNTRTGLSRFLTAFVVIAALQFLPMPAWLWAQLPGRSNVAQGFDLAGMTRPWLTLSLDPWSSLQSLVWWLPAVAVFLAARDSSAPSNRAIVWTLVGLAYVSVLLASVQALAGAAYFYTVTNYGNGVGFFSNSNHFGTFMLISMALLAGQWLHDRPRSQHRKPAISHTSMLAILLAPLALGVFLSASLACGLLMIPLLGGVMLMARPDIRINWLFVGLGSALVLVVMLYLLTTGILSNDLLAKSGTPGISRGEFATVAIKMIGDFAPFGSGLGTFPSLYPWYEQAEKIGSTYVNHAHDDLLELLVEMGLFGLILLGLFVAWLGKALWQAWSGPREDQSVVQGATLAIALTLAHSLVDYPLRTAAISGLIALCCVIAKRPPDLRSSLARSKPGAGPRESLMDI